MRSWGIRHVGQLAAAAIFAVGAAAGSASAETVPQVAMTAADIPDWTGAPDQGYEGFRFVGFSLYDTLGSNGIFPIPTKAADIRPALAKAGQSIPNDHKSWIFKLRQGVKFHDGCDWNANSAVWNFAPRGGPEGAAIQRAAPRHAGLAFHATSPSVDKIDDYTIASTPTIDELAAAVRDRRLLP